MQIRFFGKTLSKGSIVSHQFWFMTSFFFQFGVKTKKLGVKNIPLLKLPPSRASRRQSQVVEERRASITLIIYKSKWKKFGAAIHEFWNSVRRILRSIPFILTPFFRTGILAVKYSNTEIQYSSDSWTVTPTVVRSFSVLYFGKLIQSRPINRYEIVNRYGFLLIFDDFPKKPIGDLNKQF